MKKIVSFMLGVFCLAACNESEENVLIPSDALITIDAVITRATGTNFESGDKIGLTITKEDESVYADNSLLTFTEGVFAGDLKWYAEGNDAAQLTAYYPYSSTGTPTSFSVATDQTTGYNASDLIGASKADVKPTVNSVSMVFSHLLTNIVINVENETGSPISSVVLKDSYPTANIDLVNLSVEVDETKAIADIKTQQITADKTYRAIVIPQTVAFTVVVTTFNGETLTQKLTATTLKQGGQYEVDIRVLADGLDVKLSGEIKEWTNEGSIGADNSGDSAIDFEEFDTYFIYDGERYEKVTFSNGSTWMVTPLRYIPKGFTPSTDPTEDSHIWYPYTVENGTAIALTDETSIESKGYLYDFYVALGSKEITPNNYMSFENARGICPEGWHIPSRADYYALVGGSTAAEGESGTQTDENALFYEQGYSGAKIQKLNDAGFNYVFSGVRMQSTFKGNPSYQATLTTAANCSVAEWVGLLSLSHYMTSTGYKASYTNAQDPEELTNLQFFALQSTFSTSYKEGRLALAYSCIKSGAQVRCVKD